MGGGGGGGYLVKGKAQNPVVDNWHKFVSCREARNALSLSLTVEGKFNIKFT